MAASTIFPRSFTGAPANRNPPKHPQIRTFVGRNTQAIAASESEIYSRLLSSQRQLFKYIAPALKLVSKLFENVLAEQNQLNALPKLNASFQHQPPMGLDESILRMPTLSHAPSFVFRSFLPSRKVQ
jgi:hypothetical protein